MPKRRVRTRVDEIDAEALERERTAPRPAPAQAILALQRTYGNQVVQRQLSAARQRTLARDKTKKKQKSQWRDDIYKAVKAANWSKAVLGLWVLDEGEILDVLKGLSNAELKALKGTAQASIAMPMFGPGMATLYRYISFALNDPGKFKPHKQEAKVVDAGDLEVDEDVGGGHINVRTDVQYKPVGSDDVRDAGFTLDYKGKDSAKTHWLQFIWREITAEHGDKVVKLNDDITTSGGSYKLTDDPAQPNWNTDGGDKDPFYESEGGGYNNRTKDATTIFDFPGAMTAKVREQFDAGAVKVTSRAHFHTYLVRDMDVLYRVEIDIEWAFNSRDVPPRTYTVRSQQVNAIQADTRKKLIEQFPNYDYFP